jgi:glycerol-3-phosphate acyltransferase PlsY
MRLNPALYLLPMAAYFYGSIPYGLLLARLVKGVDLRTIGSGNIGATNAARVLGFKFFPVVFALDFTKGFLPTLAAWLLAGGSPQPLVVAAAVGGILGHVFPVYLRFKGGKAVAAGTGAFVVLTPEAVGVALLTWLVVFGIWRYVSLASICAAAALAVSCWWFTPDATTVGTLGPAAACLGGMLVIVLHRSNIKRLLAGTEQKIGKRKDPPESQ